MPFCPKCKFEFEEGVTHCLDCETELVKQLPEGYDIAIKWIPLKKLSSVVLAEMIKEALGNAEIEAFIKSDFFHGSFSTETTSMPGSHATIFVPEDKKEEAGQIVKDMSEEMED